MFMVEVDSDGIVKASQNGGVLHLVSGYATDVYTIGEDEVSFSSWKPQSLDDAICLLNFCNCYIG